MMSPTLPRASATGRVRRCQDTCASLPIVPRVASAIEGSHAQQVGRVLAVADVADDGDVAELCGEYFRALRTPGTPVRTFRLRLFLFPAAEEPLTPEDLALVEAIYARFDGRDDFSFRDALAVVEQSPELCELNRHIVQKALEEG